MNATDEAEFRDFVTTRAASLRRTAYLMCGDWHAAEDAVQTTFTRAYIAWGRVRSVDNTDAYVRRILLRVVIDEGRRPWRREHIVTIVPDSSYIDRSSDDRDALMTALRAMPPRQRAVVVLRYWDDMSIEDTASVLGITTGAVKSSASRGLDALRRLIGDRASLAFTTVQEDVR